MENHYDLLDMAMWFKVARSPLLNSYLIGLSHYLCVLLVFSENPASADVHDAENDGGRSSQRIANTLS